MSVLQAHVRMCWRVAHALRYISADTVILCISGIGVCNGAAHQPHSSAAPTANGIPNNREDSCLSVPRFVWTHTHAACPFYHTCPLGLVLSFCFCLLNRDLRGEYQRLHLFSECYHLPTLLLISPHVGTGHRTLLHGLPCYFSV